MIERGSDRAFLDAEPLGHRSGRHVAHDDFERNDLDFLDQLLAHVEALDEMGRHADRAQLGHQIFADAVVEHALAVEHGFLRRVERGGVVLEILDQRAGLGPLVEDLGLAFVDHAPALHCAFLCRQKRENGDSTCGPRRSGKIAMPTACGNVAKAHSAAYLCAVHKLALQCAQPKPYRQYNIDNSRGYR